MTDRLSSNRFARSFKLTTPIALAPMAFAGGGELAAASARAGALGLVGGSYGDLDWTRREYTIALEALSDDAGPLARLGCGFITWRLDEDTSALDWLLDQPQVPAALFLSFGDPREAAKSITQRGIPLICQIQTMAQLPLAVEAGASVIVAQGGEAGGHGMNPLDGRSTFTLVPEVADWLTKHSPETQLLAAGGIADGRGLAAALMLGADGALVGSRLWAARESLAPQAAIDTAIEASGDDTARTVIFDILREKNWPAEYDFRALRNALHAKWEDRIEDLRANPEAARADYREGVAQGDFTRAHVTVGEGTGLIADAPTAAEIIGRIDEEARALLG